MESQATSTLKLNLDTNLTPEAAIKAGIVFGGNYKKILVGREANPNGKMLKEALISGLLSAGADVTDGDMAPLPVFALASKNFDCTLVIDNFDDNEAISNLVALNPDGSDFNEEQIRRLMRFAEEPIELPKYNGVGTLKIGCNAIEEYIRVLSNTYENIDTPMILDCGCGSTGLCAPHILANAGADLLAIHSHVDEHYRPRPIGVAPNDIINLTEIIQNNVGSIGIAFNGNGTKMALVDEGGRYVNTKNMLALLLLYLRPGSIVVPLGMSSIIDDAFNGAICTGVKSPVTNKENRDIIRAENNIIAINNAMRENKAEIGALEDGTIIFSDISLCSDAIYSALVLAKMSVENNLREVLDSFPQYYTVEESLHFMGNHDMFSRKLQEKLTSMFPENLMHIDAWRVQMEHGWFLIVKHETDKDYIKIISESTDKTYSISMMEYAKSIVYSCF